MNPTADNPDSGNARPTSDAERIESLDVLRGFALLGILLLNVLGMGLHSSAITLPSFSGPAPETNIFTWAVIDLGFEGAMRALFSMLFGAGVVLFTSGGAGRGALWYRRNFWLLAFGLFDAWVLLWTGDILVNYAIAGALLYFARGWRARTLLIVAAVLLIGLALQSGFAKYGLLMARDVHLEVVATEAAGGEVQSEQREIAAIWTEFSGEWGADLDPVSVAREFEQRSGSYLSAWHWTVGSNIEMYTFVIPVVLFWDALTMMIVGMALFKMGVLNGSRSTAFYWRLLAVGFVGGLAVNAFEVSGAIASNFALTESFPFLMWSYHLGRMLMALGWMSALILLIRGDLLRGLRAALAAVGRMALTNYLGQSLLGLFIFTGAGLGLVGTLERWELYPIVVGIWLFQILFSLWWMKRFRFGPCEWLWRGLTYGRWPDNRVS